MKAFTLVETMIAITILTLSVSGPLLGASRALVLAEISRDQLTASYLAQEAIEYIRAMRDDSYLQEYQAGSTNLSTAAWNDFTQGSGTGSISQCLINVCTLDPAKPMGYGSTQSLNRYTSPAPLYLSNGIYTQQQIGTVTPFTRTITLTSVTSNEVLVTVTVTWSFHGTTYTVNMNDHLTSWQ